MKEVKASARLKSHPVCLTAGEGLSFEMEKYFQAVQPDASIKADRILELNVEHPAFQALEAAVEADPAADCGTAPGGPLRLYRFGVRIDEISACVPRRKPGCVSQTGYAPPPLDSGAAECYTHIVLKRTV